MKALICPYSRTSAWCAEFFPSRSLCSLPVAGKEFAEYLVDIAARLKTEEIRLLDYNYDAEFGENLGNGSRWSLKLEYRGSDIRRSVPALLVENHAFIDGSDVLIFYGAVLPEIDSMEQLLTTLEPVEGESGRMEDGVYLSRGGTLMRCKVPVSRMKNLKEYFELNFQLLRSPGLHVLPGYRVENGVHTGMNVAIKPGCKIDPPVLLCDNISLESECTLEDGVIIGRNVVLDRGNSLKHMIVLSNTFVGRDMELHDKIVDSGRLIDPVAGEYIDLGDLGVSGDLRNYQKEIDGTDICEYILAAFMALTGLIPFLFFRLLALIYKSDLWAFKLSLDCYPKLWRVLTGKCSLVRRSKQAQDWVYRYSDSLTIGRNSYQRVLDDIYFTYHRSPLLAAKTVLKAVVNRIFVTRNEFYQNTQEQH